MKTLKLANVQGGRESDLNDTQDRAASELAGSFQTRPEAMWGWVPLAAEDFAPAGHFGVRHEQAWPYMKASLLALDEHNRLRHVLVGLINVGAMTVGPSQEPKS
jgi:hypothetical protein